MRCVRCNTLLFFHPDKSSYDAKYCKLRIGEFTVYCDISVLYDVRMLSFGNEAAAAVAVAVAAGVTPFPKY